MKSQFFKSGLNLNLDMQGQCIAARFSPSMEFILSESYCNAGTILTQLHCMMQQILLIYDVVGLKIALASLADKTDSTQEHFAGKWPQDLRGLTI